MRPLPVIIIGLTLLKLAVLAVLVVLVAVYSLRLSPSDPGPADE